jgi:transcriptional regulator with XRE-family HTH domain
MTVDDVAAEQKVARSTVSSWETGSRKPDGERVADLALLYGVSTDFILFGTHMVPEVLREFFSRAATRKARSGSSPSG